MVWPQSHRQIGEYNFEQSKSLDVTAQIAVCHGKVAFRAQGRGVLLAKEPGAITNNTTKYLCCFTSATLRSK
jgi:hypothetical protein